MIRHSKSQRIAGEEALKLPDATSRTELLDMSPQERALYEIAACLDGCPSWLEPHFVRDHPNHTAACTTIDHRRLACSCAAYATRTHACGSACPLPDAVNAPRRGRHFYSSLQRTLSHRHILFNKWPQAARAAWSALHPYVPDPNESYNGVPSGLQFSALSKPKFLVSQLKQLQQQDKSVRIIVFTEHGMSQRQLVEMFARSLSHWQIFEFSSSTPPAKRHRIIREFQADHSSGYPAACIATYSAAAVGVVP